MKKVLFITGMVYTVTCLGVITLAILRPDKYGEWTGRMISGCMKAMSKEEE